MDAVGPVTLLHRLTGRRWDERSQTAGACSLLGRVLWPKRTEQPDGMARWRSSVLQNLAGCRMMGTAVPVGVGPDIGADRQMLRQLDYSEKSLVALPYPDSGCCGSNLHHRPR